MYKLLVLAAALVLCVSSAPHDGHERHGRKHHSHVHRDGKRQAEELDASSPDVLARLRRALAAANWAEAAVIKINRATAEKVNLYNISALLYTIDFDVSNGKLCTAKWTEESSQVPELIVVDCH